MILLWLPWVIILCVLGLFMLKRRREWLRAKRSKTAHDLRCEMFFELIEMGHPAEDPEWSKIIVLCEYVDDQSDRLVPAEYLDNVPRLSYTARLIRNGNGTFARTNPALN